MGIEDRDYYRDRYNKPKESGTGGGGIKYLVSPILTLAAFWYGADKLLDRLKSGRPIEPVQIISERGSITDGIVLQADRQGHFRGTALVNNVPMPFLVDTGATTTTIPATMASTAGLPYGRQVQSSTAGGQVQHHLTRIDSFIIGNVEMRGLDAQINPYLDEVLVGMNTLKYFRMTQRGNTLALAADSQQISHAEAASPSDLGEPFRASQHPAMPDAEAASPSELEEQPVQRPVKKPQTIKKSVVCDERMVCKTIYSHRRL